MPDISARLSFSENRVDVQVFCLVISRDFCDPSLSTVVGELVLKAQALPVLHIIVATCLCAYIYYAKADFFVKC